MMLLPACRLLSLLSDANDLVAAHCHDPLFCFFCFSPVLTAFCDAQIIKSQQLMHELTSGQQE